MGSDISALQSAIKRLGLLHSVFIDLIQYWLLARLEKKDG